jgi:hypothetical protein
MNHESLRAETEVRIKVLRIYLTPYVGTPVKYSRLTQGARALNDDLARKRRQNSQLL